MTPQLLIASAELLYMDVPAAFRRALGHGVGFRSLDEEERFAALLNAAVQPATPSRWRNQRAAPSTPQKDSIMDEETRNKYGHHKPKTPEDAEKIAASRRIFAEAAEKLRELLPPRGGRRPSPTRTSRRRASGRTRRSRTRGGPRNRSGRRCCNDGERK